MPRDPVAGEAHTPEDQSERPGLSFGIVREPLGWEVSRATKDALAGGEATTDLLRALQGIVREARPGFPYMWAHISASPTIRRPFTYGRDALAISLSNGWSCDMPAGKVAPAELLEPGIIAAFNIPIIAPGDLPGGSMDMLQSAGFVIPHRPSI